MGEAAFGLMDRVVEPVGDAAPGLITRQLDRTHYEPTWRAMQAFTASRSAATPDELWLTEHWPVFTLGLAGRAEHLLRDIGIPLVRSDRGGQITYHGPGQVVAYVLIDLARRRLKVRELVCLLEQSVIDLLAGYGLAGSRRSGAPGVYVGEAKIAALGLRVRSGCSYHGLSLNVDGDLEPFAAINPCGYEGLATTSLRNLGVDATFERARDALGDRLRELIATDRRTCCG